ncbi:alpha/beta hydrolase [Lederbergia galactosidilytica]|uniref:Alpha/beta hydrolase n=1 Tax=Lederbergia galactosidilytica TaxID=217031 RepID=A0A178A090_9BACI|nr:alpha/beta hydrolase [Lederbergia galactosidilytica]OAK73542.1 alpha/beta hydrolase [Lederbergia galactosidilytica]
METSTKWVTMDDGVEVFMKKWINPAITPKAILQISHGMAEHIERYSHFAQYLVSKGIFVYGNDHRGHGYTGKRMGQFGYFADHDGFERAVVDLYLINQTIQQEFSHVPHFMFGHSMGSFLARRYMQKYPHTIKGAIISGTAGNPGIAGKIGKKLASREIRKRGGTAPSPFLNRLTFGSYNKKIPHPQTEFDWLTRDTSKVKEYIEDPFCGFICSNGFFYDLFVGLEKIHDDQQIRKVPSGFPVLLISGENDPVGGKNLTGVYKVVKQWEDNGLKNIKTAFFEQSRHELLNEMNQLEVYQFIYDWINSKLNE